MSDSNQPVSLGCGTLILIALIVLIFSNANKDEEQQLRDLRSDVQALTEEVRIKPKFVSKASQQPHAELMIPSLERQHEPFETGKLLIVWPKPKTVHARDGDLVRLFLIFGSG